MLVGVGKMICVEPHPSRLHGGAPPANLMYSEVASGAPKMLEISYTFALGGNPSPSYKSLLMSCRWKTISTYCMCNIVIFVAHNIA